MSEPTPPNIPNPDPSLATNERLANAIDVLSGRMERNREEARAWVDALQLLLEEKVNGAIRILETRLNGNDTALVAALQAQKEAAQKQTDSFAAILSESKSGSTKQIDGLNEKIDDLKERMSESGGRAEGSGHTTSMIIAGAAALAAIASVVIVLVTKV
jgi:polyhydroxyalkanoate synthesis regulator phasin